MDIANKVSFSGKFELYRKSVSEPEAHERDITELVDEDELKKAAYLGLNVVASILFPQEYATMAERSSSTVSFPGISSKDVLSDVLRQGAQRMRNILKEGDIEEAMRAAEAIGDDRLQRQSHGYVVPDSFTHGSSEQRARWFRRGLQTGDMRAGDTFNDPSL